MAVLEQIRRMTGMESDGGGERQQAGTGRLSGPGILARLSESGQGGVNVGRAERAVSVAAGTLVAIQGLSRGSLGGVLCAAAGAALIYRGASGHCHMYQALGIDTAESEGGSEARTQERGVEVREAFLINRPAQDLYDFWRNFENLPPMMRHLISVTKLDDRRSHWIAKAPKIAGGQVEWDAEVTADEPGRRIAWRSVGGSKVDTAGEVRFEQAPGDRGTVVHVAMSYLPPAGRLGHWVAKLFGEAPTGTIREDLRRFKAQMETGEAPTTVGQSRGTCTGQGKVQASE